MTKAPERKETVSEVVRCQACGIEFEWTHPKGGRRRRFCSQACREYAWFNQAELQELHTVLNALHLGAVALPQFAGSFALAADLVRRHLRRRTRKAA